MFIKNIKKLSILTSIFLLLSTSASFADINVSRIAGNNRYDTAVKVNDEFIEYSSTNTAIISSGSDFRTSLYASYMASGFKAPLYLNTKHGMTTQVLNKLKEKKVTNVYIVGGYDLLDKSIDNTLLSKGIKFTRIYDQTKYDKWTKTNFVDKIPYQVDNVLFTYFHPNVPRGDIGSCILINDRKFPDMLSVIPLTAQLAKEDTTGMYDYRGFDSTDGFKLIIGGPSTVSGYIKTYMGNDAPGLNDNTWEDAEEGTPRYYTGRISGENRYQTAVEIAKTYNPLLGYDLNTIVLVNGENYPDALTSGIAAVSSKAAILLTEPNKLNSDTKSFIQDNGIENVIIIGGEKSVSKNIEKELRNLK